MGYGGAYNLCKKQKCFYAWEWRAAGVVGPYGVEPGALRSAKRAAGVVGPYDVEPGLLRSAKRAAGVVGPYGVEPGLLRSAKRAAGVVGPYGVQPGLLGSSARTERKTGGRTPPAKKDGRIYPSREKPREGRPLPRKMTGEYTPPVVVMKLNLSLIRICRG